MALHDYEPRIARNALHRKEEQVKQVFLDQGHQPRIKTSSHYIYFL